MDCPKALGRYVDLTMAMKTLLVNDVCAFDGPRRHCAVKS